MTALTAETTAAPLVARTTSSTIPMARLTGVELRKMFDTRSGFWLMAGIVISAVLATTVVILFAPDDAVTYSSFASAVGFPMAVILPMVAILSVTSEWTQRSGLTTFTLVPHRGRVLAAKAAAAVSVAVVSMVIAFAVGAVGNLVGSALNGTDAQWDMQLVDGPLIVLANTLGLLLGFMLGVLLRSSAGAIVAYFVWSLLLPTLGGLLAQSQEWFRDLQPWVDFNYAQSALFNGAPSSEQWAQLGVAGTLWLLVPLIIGLRLLLRSEVK